MIVSSIFEYMADLPKQDCNNGGLIMELSDVYYDIRMNERLWFGDNDTIKQYLKNIMQIGYYMPHTHKRQFNLLVQY